MSLARASDLIAESNGVLKAAVVDPCSPGGFLGEAVKHSYGWVKNFADLMSLEMGKTVAEANGWNYEKRFGGPPDIIVRVDALP